ncbi:MAG: Asp23/Gls24 family envelope stress response protein [Candidatus Omnitrophota bacterium]
MIRDEDKNDFGTIKIHDDVIASVAYLTAQQVEGVARICENPKSMALNLLGKKTKSGGIDVKSEKLDNLSIVIPVIIKYGYNIPEVASKIQDKVKNAIEETTDLSPKDIIIKIKGVER